MKRQMENNRRDNQQEENMKEAVLKLTTLSWKKISTSSTPSACCYGDQLQGQLRGSSGFSVFVSICVFVQGTSVHLHCVMSEH